MKKRLIILVTLVAAVAAPASFFALTPARAATGDNLATFNAITTAGIPSCSTGTGLAFDGTTLFLSCWSSNVLQRVNAATHASGGAALTIAGATDIRAMAYDGTRAKIWACNGNSSVVLIDTTALTATAQFTVAGCTDGLAYDGADDTIWASPDANNTIYHYSNTGTLLASFSGLTAKLGGFGNSGIAVGGTTLYLGNDGGSQIYQCDKALAACTLMSTFPARIEDLECDNVTFPGKNAIWSQDAYDRILNAWEIPAGTCGVGGGAGGVTPTATTTQVRLKTQTPTRTATPADTATPTPVTPTNTPAVTNTPASSPTPTGGRAGVIVGPNTGSGPGGGSSRSLYLFGAALLVAGVGIAGAAARRTRRG